MSPLSPQQQRTLEVLHRHLERTGRPPTGPELAQHLGVTHQTAYQHLRALEQKGYVELVQTGTRKTLQVRLLPPARLLLRTAWPRLGTIPAGPLDYAEADLAADVEAVERVEDLLPALQPGDFFLEIDGDSMIGAGLEHGMTAVIRPGQQPRPGDICAVWVEGEGGTLKRVYPEGASVRLVPENEAYPERTLPAEQVRIQGVLVLALLVRRF